MSPRLTVEHDWFDGDRFVYDDGFTGRVPAYHRCRIFFDNLPGRLLIAKGIAYGEEGDEEAREVASCLAAERMARRIGKYRAIVAWWDAEQQKASIPT